LAYDGGKLSKYYTYSVEQNKVVCCVRLSTYIFYFSYCISNTTGYPLLKSSNSVDFSVGLPRGTTYIQTIFDICPRVSKNVKGYRSHSVPFPGFQTLKVVVFDLVDEVRTRLYHMVTPQIYQLNLHMGTADGGTVVKVLCYKLEGRWFDSR
jgi:hypothetical protein